MSVDVQVVRGRDVVDPGTVRVVRVGSLAVACSPGAVVAVDALRDPNEDAAVVARASDGTWLAAVVDGNGTTAGADAVVDHLVEHAAVVLAASHPDVVGLLAGAMERLHTTRRAGAHATGASVTVVVGRGSGVWTWTRGDTAAVLVGTTHVRALGGVVPLPVPPAPVPGSIVGERAADEHVVLMTDGMFEALGGDWCEVVGGVGGDDAAARARAMVAAALERGARDAVTVAIAAPTGPSGTNRQGRRPDGTG